MGGNSPTVPPNLVLIAVESAGFLGIGVWKLLAGKVVQRSLFSFVVHLELEGLPI